MKSAESREVKILHRDNSRFKFFSDNGKAILADGFSGEIPSDPVLLLVRNQKPIART